MEKNRIGRWMWAVLLLPALLLAQQPDSLVQLPDLIQEGLANNPGLKSGYNLWQADEARVPQAGALPDPQLSFNLMNLPVNSFAFDQEPMTGKQIGVMQMFPFPGKLGLRQDVAQSGAEVSKARYEELQNQLKKKIALTFYSIYFVDQSISTTVKNQEILNQFTRIAETRYSVGKGVQQDVLKAQVERSKMEDKLITLRQKRRQLAAKLNALLNRNAGAPLGPLAEPALAEMRLPADSLKSLTRQNRPLFSAWESMVTQSDKKVKLAKKQYLPDMKVGVTYTQREELQNGAGGVDFLSGMFTVDIPLYFWKKQKKNVEENRYRRKKVEEQYSDVRSQVYAELESVLSEVEKNWRLLNLYRDGIIPQAQQSLNSAISGYQTDKVDFLTLLNNQMTLYNYELDYHRVFTDYQKGLAQLDAVTGTRLEN